MAKTILITQSRFDRLFQHLKDNFELDREYFKNKPNDCDMYMIIEEIYRKINYKIHMLKSDIESDN